MNVLAKFVAYISTALNILQFYNGFCASCFLQNVRTSAHSKLPLMQRTYIFMCWIYMNLNHSVNTNLTESNRRNESVRIELNRYESVRIESCLYESSRTESSQYEHITCICTI